MTADSRAQAQTEYTYGQAAFENGEYRRAVDHLETAVGIAKASTPLGGEIQIWLVNAYNAVGRSREAEVLCDALTRHPDLEVRKQAKNLLYILQAPQLRRPGNWMSQIPDLGTLDEGDHFSGRSLTTTAPRSAPKRAAKPEPPPLDPSQINSRDNGFLWLALGLVGLVLGGLLWLS